METMHNNTSSKGKKLDSKSKLILVISFALALIFFIIAFTMGGARKISVYENKYVSTDYGDYVDFKFKPNSSGYYYLACDNGRLVYGDFEYDKLDSDGKNSSSYNDEYDNVYKIYVEYSDQVYKFEICSQTYGEIEVYITENCPAGYKDK